MFFFADHNPIAVFAYYIATVTIIMFTQSPVLVFLSLLGALIHFFMQNKTAKYSTEAYFLLLFIITALINPIFSHKGQTVLLVINNAPITLEAILYGFFAAAMLMASIYWFRALSTVMTSDKLLYVFGKFSPKLSLILSMALRYVPLFTRQAKKTRDAQKALGIYNEDNVIDRSQSGVRVFSVMVSWALENGITTADSMSARGYGVAKRTHFSIFKFTKSDFFLLLSTLLLFLLTALAVAFGALEFEFYPQIKAPSPSWLSFLGYISYGALIILPTFIDAKENIKWHYLRSKI